MADRIIQTADLSTIEQNLVAANQQLHGLSNSVQQVNSNMKVIYDDLSKLSMDFQNYVNTQNRANRLVQAETRLVKIRQELDKKYGHYDIVRRTTVGILQADDLGLVKKDTIANATEDLMINTPGYWLAPCLVALAAWINDKKVLAEKALKEAIKRNDENTSLFFALICRRADRKDACQQWLKRYLETQDEENIDRKTVVVLDAFASGLFGPDNEGLIFRQINTWLEKLSEKPNFVEEQRQEWKEAIHIKRKPIPSDSYPCLRKYSRTWPVLENILEGAYLHKEIEKYLIGVFSQNVSTRMIKEQIDGVLENLVTGFDDEELPLRRQEKKEQFVVDYNGDEARADKSMEIEKTAFETHKSFTQLLTDSAMKPETSNASVSTQKFAFSLSKDWVLDAYNDLIAENRMKIPNEIEINVDNFNDKTKDGENEEELVRKFINLVDSELEEALKQYEMSMFVKYCLYGGAALGVLGLFYMASGSTFSGIVCILAGVGAVLHHFSDKKRIEQSRQQITDQYEHKKDQGGKIIRATIAEVVDFRHEFAERDAESQGVIDFLEKLSPEQYIKKLADSIRRVKM